MLVAKHQQNIIFHSEHTVSEVINSMNSVENDGNALPTEGTNANAGGTLTGVDANACLLDQVDVMKILGGLQAADSTASVNPSEEQCHGKTRHSESEQNSSGASAASVNPDDERPPNAHTSDKLRLSEMEQMIMSTDDNARLKEDEVGSQLQATASTNSAGSNNEVSLSAHESEDDALPSAQVEDTNNDDVRLREDAPKTRIEAPSCAALVKPHDEQLSSGFRSSERLEVTRIEDVSRDRPQDAASTASFQSAVYTASANPNDIRSLRAASLGGNERGRGSDLEQKTTTQSMRNPSIGTDGRVRYGLRPRRTKEKEASPSASESGKRKVPPRSSPSMSSRRDRRCRLQKAMSKGTENQIDDKSRSLKFGLRNRPASPKNEVSLSTKKLSKDKPSSSFSCTYLEGNGLLGGEFALYRETKVRMFNGYARKLALESDWLDVRQDETDAALIVERMGDEEWTVLSSMSPIFSRMLKNKAKRCAFVPLNELCLFRPLSTMMKRHPRRQSQFFVADYSCISDKTHEATVKMLEVHFTNMVRLTLNAFRSKKECYILCIGTMEEGEVVEADAVAICGLPAADEGIGALDLATKRADPINAQEYRPAILYYISVRSNLKRKRVGSDLVRSICALVRYRGLGPPKIVAAVPKGAAAFYKGCQFAEQDWREQCNYVRGYAERFGMVGRRGGKTHTAWVLRGFLQLVEHDDGDGYIYDRCHGTGQ